jgi:hypothetical protein
MHWHFKPHLQTPPYIKEVLKHTYYESKVQGQKNIRVLSPEAVEDVVAEYEEYFNRREGGQLANNSIFLRSNLKEYENNSLPSLADHVAPDYYFVNNIVLATLSVATGIMGLIALSIGCKSKKARQEVTEKDKKTTKESNHKKFR